MFTINRGNLSDILFAFESGNYSRAMLYVKDVQQGRQLLESLDDWDISRRDFRAKKNGKVIQIVYDVEHVYGLAFDYIGFTGSFPSNDDFLYYVSRLRKVL